LISIEIPERAHEIGSLQGGTDDDDIHTIKKEATKKRSEKQFFLFMLIK